MRRPEEPVFSKNPLLHSLLHATIAVTCLSALIALLYWLIMGESPWPAVILGEIAGFGFGIAMLALASPRAR